MSEIKVTSATQIAGRPNGALLAARMTLNKALPKGDEGMAKSICTQAFAITFKPEIAAFGTQKTRVNVTLTVGSKHVVVKLLRA